MSNFTIPASGEVFRSSAVGENQDAMGSTVHLLHLQLAFKLVGGTVQFNPLYMAITVEAQPAEA